MIKEVKLHPKGYILWVRLFKAYALSIYTIQSGWGCFFLQSSILNIDIKNKKEKYKTNLRSQNMHIQFRGEI